MRKRRVLISVSDKSGIVDFAKKLVEKGFEIISTGGTYSKLLENNIDVLNISEVTGFPECLEGRVKTLHPKVHGGILARRDKSTHMKAIDELDIELIDMVVINLYPFKETIQKEGVTMEEAIENIDIGGPTMLRSAAKNHKDVIVICDPNDYEKIIQEMDENRELDYNTKYKLALKVFEHTAYYDSLIADYLRKSIDAELPEKFSLAYEKVQGLRYGENPHQKAYYYKEAIPQKGSIVLGKQLQGKELSFNNINDSEGAIATLKEFDEPTAVAVKHANPCGVGTGEDIFEAYQRAYECDPVSIFGGIVAVNREVDKKTAEKMKEIFLEIIIAPSFSKEAIDILSEKKNLRLIELENISEKAKGNIDIKKVSGGILVQEYDDKLFDKQLEVVTKVTPTDEELNDLKIAMKVVKHIKSNGIVFVKNGMTIAVSPGQVNRIWAVENCIKQSNFDLKGAVMASDAFFPFDDCVSVACKAGITSIIQPGGSVRDEDSIKKADEMKISMVFGGMRHFKH